MEVRLKLRERRRQLKMTQAELAEKLGVDRSFISLLEKGKRRLTVEFAAALMVPLRCKLEDIIETPKVKRAAAGAVA